MLGRERLNYAENHIEADNRLSWFLGRLDKQFGNTAFYIHLTRNADETARSYAPRVFSGAIIPAYRNGILFNLDEDVPNVSVTLDYCDTVNSNISLFLKDKDHKLVISLENITEDFCAFWKAIDAKGDLSAALAEFDTKYNATKTNKQKQASKKTHLFLRIIAKLQRLITKLPSYIKDA